MTVLKFIGAPGSVPFLALCLCAGAVLFVAAPRRRWMARAWVGTVAAVYLVLGLPCAANAITADLPSVQPDPASWRVLNTIVVLDGDNRRGRVNQASRVYHAAEGSAEVWVFGSAWMLDPLLQAGIPYNQIRYGGNSATTRDQMDQLKAFLSSTRRVGVIASRLQVSRVMALASRLGLTATWIASPIDVEPPTQGYRALIPSYFALRTSRDALYEIAANRYYRYMGWIA